MLYYTSRACILSRGEKEKGNRTREKTFVFSFLLCYTNFVTQIEYSLRKHVHFLFQ